MAKITMTIEGDLDEQAIRDVLLALNGSADSMSGVSSAALGDTGAAAPAATGRRGGRRAAETSPAAAAAPAIDVFGGGQGPAPAPLAPAEPPTEITYDMLKDAMTALLKKTSASAAQKTLLDATQAPSLSVLTPEQYAVAYAALTKAAG